MFRVVLAAGVAFFFGLSEIIAETVGSGKPLRIEITGPIVQPYPLLLDRYFPRVSAFTKDKNKARAYASEEWNGLSLLQKANYVRSVYGELNRAHGYDYSTRVMTCKVYRESTFDTQIKNPISSASGLAQVTFDTAIDIFATDRLNFRSKIPGFEHISTREKYFEMMADSPVAQMELGLAAIRLKDTGGGGEDNMRPILKNYYGSKDNPELNRIYAYNILQCAKCIKDNQDTIAESCLNEATLNIDPGEDY